MYPATIFNWHDQSQISTATTSVVVDNSPLLMQVFSADKGTEDLIEISGADFTAMYGTMNFAKHGQSAIQAKAIIDAGGRLYAKRVVADDAKLANVVLCASLADKVRVTTTTQAGVTTITYVDRTPESTEGTTTEGGNTVTTKFVTSIKWSSQAIENCKTFEEVKTAAIALKADNVYPLIIYTDNGRGVSGKKVRLTPDYATSKTIGKTFYTLSVYESTSVVEQKSISFDPTIVYNDNGYRLDEYTNVQISGLVIETEFERYVKALSEKTLIEEDVIRTYDLVFGYTNRGAAIDNIILDAESVDLDAETGIELTKGSNGAFGDAPVDTTAWTEAIRKVFSGDFSDEVYDVDAHMITAICDANYPEAVKNAICDLVYFRKDCIFLRDFGTGLNTFRQIKAEHDKYVESHSNFFVLDYATSYMIVDPLSKKNIEVTMMYDMAPLLVTHASTNIFAPLCGIANGFILPSAIEGTVSFTPVNTPSVNQKDAIEEIKVNYAIFHDSQCVVQSCYTAQEEYTQLSYGNNVLGIQQVLRAVRKECPAQRYTLVSGNDLTEYATAVSKVLSNFTSNFTTLNFVYTQDDLKTSQKIFYASIEFAFLNWAQTEIFDVYAINN